ncbi:MAG: YCII-related domain protein [Sphaerisporangium sp.]|jgi:hypothetical protein|nr:YCII-related domain protein [Sphaerisporangium sp.]
MKYMLSVYGNDELWGSYTQEQFAAMVAEDAAFQKELRDSGELVSAEGLTDAAEVRTVRVKDGATVVAEGPYLDVKEHVGCYFIVDCENLERAIEVAAKYPAARDNGVEVWPLMDQGGSDA